MKQVIQKDLSILKPLKSSLTDQSQNKISPFIIADGSVVVIGPTHNDDNGYRN